jgi:predicted small lipoprotein YifL
VALNLLDDRRVLRLAAIGALVAALSLAGCGRKSGLDLPPAAAVPVQPDTATVEGEPAPDPDARPVAANPNGQKRRIPILDWLID